MPSGFASKWTEGIFLALIDKTNEYVIGTPTGVIKSQSIKLLPRNDASDPMLFNAAVGTPRNPSPTLLGGEGRVDDIPVKRIVVRAAAAPKAQIPLESPREGVMVLSMVVKGA